MGKCKCIKTLSRDDIEFIDTKYYDSDFIQSTGDQSPFFRVYHPDGKHAVMSFLEFKNHFKKL